MSYKPNDVFLGVIDLFVVVLPGALAIFVALRIGYGYPEVALPPTTWSYFTAGTAFAAGSYLIGHVISLICSKIEDEYWTDERIDKEEPNKLRPEVERRLIHEFGMPVEGARKSVRRWAAKVLRTGNETVAATVDRKDADRRFCRNAAVVLIVPAVVIALQGSWAEAAVWAGLAVLCVARYFDQHRKYERDVFEYFVLLPRPDGEPVSRNEHAEIERRFLVTSNAWKKDATGTRLRQGYLCTDPERVVRVRTEGSAGRLTIKGKKVGARAAEFEYPIPVSDAASLLEKLCLPEIIDKTRYTLRLGKTTWEIDEFHGANTGLVIAEVELSSEDQDFEKPTWLGREVTEDSRYQNAPPERAPVLRVGRLR